MITCPWCGTHYEAFQSNCSNCGGPLPLPAESATRPAAGDLPVPPSPPRAIPANYIRRILATDGWTIAAGIFALMGLIFGATGTVLTVTVVAAVVGIPFMGIGFLFLAAGIPLLIWRYQEAQETIQVLQEGKAALGEIMTVEPNYQVRINGRHPWTILYRFELSEQTYQGKVTTLSMPDLSQQRGQPAYILYLPENPLQNTIYPSPYGYYGL